MLLTLKITAKNAKAEGQENDWLPPDTNLVKPALKDFCEDSSLILKLWLRDGKCFLMQGKELVPIDFDKPFLVGEQSITLNVEALNSKRKTTGIFNDWFGQPDWKIETPSESFRGEEKWYSPDLAGLSKRDPLDFLEKGLALDLSADFVAQESVLTTSEINDES
jgi:hypothetical protein